MKRILFAIVMAAFLGGTADAQVSVNLRFGRGPTPMYSYTGSYASPSPAYIHYAAQAAYQRQWAQVYAAQMQAQQMQAAYQAQQMQAAYQAQQMQAAYQAQLQHSIQARQPMGGQQFVSDSPDPWARFRDRQDDQIDEQIRQLKQQQGRIETQLSNLMVVLIAQQQPPVGQSAAPSSSNLAAMRSQLLELQQALQQLKGELVKINQ